MVACVNFDSDVFIIGARVEEDLDRAKEVQRSFSVLCVGIGVNRNYLWGVGKFRCIAEHTPSGHFGGVRFRGILKQAKNLIYKLKSNKYINQKKKTTER